MTATSPAPLKTVTAVDVLQKMYESTENPSLRRDLYQAAERIRLEQFVLRDGKLVCQ